MSRPSTAAEKIMATAGTFRALSDELPPGVDFDSPIVQGALIEASVRIAMGTLTNDIGILAPQTMSNADVQTLDDHAYSDTAGRNLCDVCDQWQGAPAHANR